MDKRFLTPGEVANATINVGINKAKLVKDAIMFLKTYYIRGWIYGQKILNTRGSS